MSLKDCALKISYRTLEDDVIITYYVKAFFQQENGQWKLQHEQRETAYKK